MSKPLEKEFRWYLTHQDDLLKKYNGRVIVIKNQTVIGDFKNEFEAIEKTSKSEELGTFLVQLCKPGTDSYTQTFHSRVSFA